MTNEPMEDPAAAEAIARTLRANRSDPPLRILDVNASVIDEAVRAGDMGINLRPASIDGPA